MPRSLVRRTALALALGATPAGAQDLCAGLSALIASAEQGSEGAGSPPAAFAGADDCRQVLEIGGKSYYCAWAHPLKAPEAEGQARALEAAIARCFPEARPRDDLGVNHPDSYQAREYALPTARITVAVKEKAQLGRTFVFLRVGRP